MNLQEINYAKYIIDYKSDKTAIIHDEGVTSYRELGQLVKQFAYQLKNNNIHPGERVVIVMSDRIEWIVGFLGCVYVGAIPTVISPLLKPAKYIEALDITRASAIISDIDRELIDYKSIKIFTPEDIMQGGELLEEYYQYLSDEIAVINTSSGTTGKQKFIAHRHQNFTNYLKYTAEAFAVAQDSMLFGTSKMSHVAGFNVSITIALGNQATAIITRKSYTQKLLYRLITENKVSHFFSQPGVYAMMSNVKKSLLVTTLKFAGCFSQQYPIEIAKRFKRIYGCGVSNGFGMSEAFSVVIIQQYDKDKEIVDDKSLGKPMPGIVCEVRNDQGTLCQKNEVGELYINTPCSATYYLNNWDNTKETFVGDWIKTNDLVYIDDHDNLVYVSRKDDFVKINGLLISVLEVEQTLSQHPNVVDCLVKVSKNKEGLAKLKAQIVTNTMNDTDIPGIRHFLAETLELCKIPKYIEIVNELPISIVDEIPKTWSGKKIRQIEEEVE